MSVDEPTIVERKPRRAEETTLFGARYRPIALLGSGGMGSVYLARDMQLDELVAVKVLRSDLGSGMLERFRDEVRLARRVSSPFVARTHDLAEHEGRFFVTMQYVEGETLSALLRRRGRLSSDELVPIARDLCEGLAAVHAANVVHRDLKPANVMMTTSGRAMLTDFGIALRADSATGRTDGYGTPTYTAPEQMEGKTVDARADIYALGATLYALATGKRPFASNRTGREEPPDPRHACADVPDALAAIITRAMQIDPADRFQSCEAVRAAIDALRPTASVARPPALRALVRSLGARAARRVAMTFDARGVSAPLAEAVRDDLVARLDSRGRVRVARAGDDAEASLDARFASAGDRFSLALRLESLGDGYVFWSDALEGPQRALPQLLEHVSNAIERAFVPTSTPSPASSPFESAEVASLFLEARAEYRGFWGPRLRRSIELLDKARALAPEHPLILAWCAAAHSRNRFFESSGADVGRELAERAVALAPEIPEVHIALATSHMQSLRTLEAVPHFVKALRLAPGLLEQRVAFARLLSECGAVEPSLALARGAVEADRSYCEPIELLLRHHALRGRLDLAARESERAIGAKDAFVAVGLARYATWYHDRATFDVAVARLDVAALDAQPRAFVQLYADIFAGNPAAVDAITAMGASGMPRRRAFFKQIMAELWAFRQDDERTFIALEEAIDLGFYDVQWFDMCPILDAIRGTLRFETLHATVRARATAVLTEVERCLEPLLSM